MSKGLKVQQASKWFDGRSGDQVIALDRATLSLPAGGFGALIGPSGCGKSTLLRMIADITPPSSGTILIGDERPSTARRAHAIGFVFQSATLLPWRTVRANIELPLAIVGKRSGRIAGRSTDELIELVNLKGFENALPAQLSGGMQQRASIARALVLQPDILLLDEPFGALDEISRQKMNLELLRIWSESGTTALLVTHSIGEAVFMADSVFVMSPRPGKVSVSVEVPLPRPRTLQMMGSREFFDTVNRVREGLFGADAQTLFGADTPQVSLAAAQ
jgi:NitT/TauT family transport system ATP-binding protein